MDCLRTAIRCGARETLCLYRRDFANMPGSRKEFRNAVEEGAKFTFLASAVEVEGKDGSVTGIRCVRMKLGEVDQMGRKTPYPLPESEFHVPADVVLVAYGFDAFPLPPDSEWSDIKINEFGGIEVNDYQMTSVPKVFSGGDEVRGSNLVVTAVRDGRRGALGIHRYLSGES